MKIKPGTIFVTTWKRPWSGPGFNGTQWHAETVLCMVTEVKEHRAEYVAVKLLEESGRPPNVAPTRFTQPGGFSLNGHFEMKLPTKTDIDGVDFPELSKK
jgi:hypothetical protein